MNRKQKKLLLRILSAAALILIFRFLPDFCGKGLLYLVPYLIAGYDILRKALHGIRNGQPFDENFLMAAATIGAAALGEYTEGAAVMLFYQTGELFQSIAVGRSRKSISALMDIRPDRADREQEDGSIETVDPDEVAVGSVIVIKPGDKVPIDGVVLSGSSSLDTSALTGESRPRSIVPGEEIQSGCINRNGLLRVRTTREAGESTAAKILELVENAGSRKSRSENFITKFAAFYTPAVCFSALALFLIPPLILLLLQKEPGWGNWLYRALTFLVISCPCALVISIPLTFFAGLGGAGRRGILIKGSNYMETLSKVRCMVFDKTGTLTRGVFEVTEVSPAGREPSELLSYAACAESASTHPIARSILRKYGKEPDRSRISNTNEISGRGVTAEVDGIPVAFGNRALMDSLGIDLPDRAQEPSGTAVYAAIDGRYAGVLLISDILKPEAPEALEKLRALGITKTVLLTGDSRSAAAETAEILGIDEVCSGLLPQDKVAKVEELLASLEKNERLAFAGDGINDAPVLTRSDVGIAMGALGSDAAIEAADVVLMDDDPRKIAEALLIARKCLRIVYENIFFAIGIKLICLILGALGITGMWAAVFADVGVMVLAVLNAIRALRV